MPELKAEKEELEKENHETSNALKIAREESEKIRAAKKTEKTRDELEIREKEIESKKTDANQKIGRINEQLDENEKHRKEFALMQEKIEKSAEQKAM